jgi:hypothetical protein
VDSADKETARQLADAQAQMAAARQAETGEALTELRQHLIEQGVAAELVRTFENVAVEYALLTAMEQNALRFLRSLS